MEAIKYATKEQVDAIYKESNITNATSVFAYKDATAVVRPVVELDPIHFGTLSAKERILFIWGLENILRANGVQEFYFNIQDTPENVEWTQTAKHLGAEAVSIGPEIRYKKRLD